MKKKQKIIAAIVLIIILVATAIFYQSQLPTDRCTKRDREINNCVPAGKCGPTPAIDAVIDCDPKNYDRKFNTEL